MKKFVGLLVAATAACGNDGVHHLPDGPPTPIDAANIDAAPQPVTLTIMSDGVAQANVPVYFQGADSSVISTTMTDANGVASALMPHGGFVTATDPFPINAGSAANATATGTHYLRTFADVKPGDHLKLDNTTTTPYVTMTVNLPIDAGTTNAYWVFNSCSGGYSSAPASPGGSGSAVTPTTTAYLYGCAGTTADFMVVSLDPSNRPLNYLFAPNIAVSANGTVDLTAQTYVGAIPTTFNVNNIPAFMNYGNYYSLLYGTAKGVFTTNYFTSPIGGTGNQVATVNALGGTGTFMAESIQLSSRYGQHQIYRWGATPTGANTYTFDAAGTLIDFSNYPAFDQPSASVIWTSNAGVKPDGYYANIYFQRSTDNLYWYWEVAGAYNGLGSVHVPTLPGDGASYNTSQADYTNVQDVGLLKAPTSWDAVRPSIFDLIDQGDPSQLVVGASGQFEVEWSGNNAAIATTPGNQAHRRGWRH